MKGKTKQQKGITLIALIITIVVLLILAAVAISSIQNDGILRYAQNAADNWNKAQGNEAGILDGYLDYLNRGNCSNHIWVESEEVNDKGYEVYVCSNCNAKCAHTNMEYEYFSDDSGYHDIYEKCTICNQKFYSDTDCCLIGIDSNNCIYCDFNCNHELEYNDVGDEGHEVSCMWCSAEFSYVLPHDYNDGVCNDCGFECEHDLARVIIFMKVTVRIVLMKRCVAYVAMRLIQ